MRNYLTLICVSLILTTWEIGEALAQQYVAVVNGTVGQRIFGQIAQSRTTWVAPNPNPVPPYVYIGPSPSGISMARGRSTTN